MNNMEYPPEVYEVLQCFDELKDIPENLKRDDWVRVCIGFGLVDDIAEQEPVPLDTMTCRPRATLYGLTDFGIAVLRSHDSGSKRKRVAKPSNQPKKVNARMLEEMQQNADCHGWTCRQWADHLKCSKPAVTDTDTWKMLREIREKQKADKEMENDRRRRRRPR